MALHPPLISSLLAGLGLPDSGAPPQLVETHASWVVLTRDFAYKIKKPITLPFLDYGSLARREACCRAEVLLNRRLAPGLYLDAIPIGGDPAHPVIGSEPAIEWAVCMTRFDEAGRLDHLAAHGQLQPEQLVQLAETLVRFHAGSAIAPPGSRFGEPAQVLSAARENFVELRQLLPMADQPTVAKLAAWTEAEFARHANVFASRKKEGAIREGHGDLHLGNLVLIDGQVTPFDCIEFNDDFRWNDPAGEVAFVWIDLLDHDQPGLAAVFLNAWLEAGGDFGALAVLRFYAAYRAVVRAKVAALRASQEEAGAAAGELASARKYLELAWRIAVPPAPTLTITCGMSGSGKTTATTARMLDPMRPDAGLIVRLRSDVERKRLYGFAATEPSGSPIDGGIYTPDANRRTYARLHELARQSISSGWPVLVDAAFLRRDERVSFRTLAKDAGVEFRILHADAPDAELRRRIAAHRVDASEATLEVLERQQAWFEPLDAEERELSLTA